MQARWVVGKTVKRLDQSPLVDANDQQFQAIGQIVFSDGSMLRFVMREMTDKESCAEAVYYPSPTGRNGDER